MSFADQLRDRAAAERAAAQRALAGADDLSSAAEAIDAAAAVLESSRQRIDELTGWLQAAEKRAVDLGAALEAARGDVAASTAEHARLTAALVAMTAARDALQAIIDAGVTTPPPVPAPEPAPAPAPEPAPPPPVPAPAGRYRYNQPLLFQPARPPYPSRIPGGQPFAAGNLCGPTHRYVDSGCGWPWDKPGGDWVDADGTRHGPTAWASHRQAALAPNADTPTTVTLDVTAIAQRGTWMAMLLRCANAQRHLINAGAAAPTITYTYADGSPSAVLQPVTLAAIGSSTVPQLHLARAPLPCFVEFPRPGKPVTHAELTFAYVNGNYSSFRGGALFEVFLLDPPINTDPVELGVAQGCVLDDGLASKPGMLGVHRYLPGMTTADVALAARINTQDERSFDPSIFDPAAPADLTKLPHRGQGLWVGAGANWSLVGPDHQAPGFAPLHPALGALCIDMPAEVHADGATITAGGTEYGNAAIYLPIDRLGKQRRIVLRYHARIAFPGGRPPGPADRLQVYTQPIDPKNPDAVRQTKWCDLGGKAGPHVEGMHTTEGGYSGTAGLNRGTQFRSGWGLCTEGLGGPGEGGWYMSHHMYDFNSPSIPGHL